MPELPEVETTVRDLRPKVRGRTFLDVWSDAEKLVRKPNFSRFEEQIKEKKIRRVRRRGKYVLFDLSRGKVLLVHQKLTGHLLYGRWEKEGGGWSSRSGPMREKMNSYLHLVFKLDNGKMLAFSDLRKFGRVELWDREEFEGRLSDLGPEPLSPAFSFEDFKERFKRRRARIKSLLMDQSFIAGVGNIYANEILWRTRLHPERKADTLSEGEKRRIYEAMRAVLKEAIRLKGTSTSDYRTLEGEFGSRLKVYGREGEECPRCGREIEKMKTGGRTTYYCPRCQRKDRSV